MSKRTNGFRRHSKYAFARTVKRIRRAIGTIGSNVMNSAQHVEWLEELKNWLYSPEVTRYINKYNL